MDRSAVIAEARDCLALALAIEKRDGKAIVGATKLLQSLGDRFTEQDQQAIQALVTIDCIPTALYRHFAADGSLLYIGVSMTVTGRTAHHETYAPWFQQIDHIKLQWFGSRSSALNAERRAIKAEKPRHNITHNGKREKQCQPSPTRGRKRSASS